LRDELKFLLSLLLRLAKQSGIKFGHGFFGSFIWFGDFFGFVFNDSFKNLLILVTKMSEIRSNSVGEFERGDIDAIDPRAKVLDTILSVPLLIPQEVNLAREKSEM
jgi:hypothetical protein